MKNDGKYKWLLFDADDTLLDFHRAEHDALADTLRAFSIPADDGMIEMYSRINDGLWKKLERGLVTKDRLRVQRYEEFIAAAGYDADAENMARTYESYLAQKSYLLPGAMETCRRFYGRYAMYIITNGIVQIQRPRFGGSGLAPMFEHCFISDEIGVQKPGRGFFDAVAAYIDGFDVSAALVIGDSLTSDIRGGAGYGMDTCWIDRQGKGAPEGAGITYIIKDITGLPDVLEASGTRNG